MPEIYPVFVFEVAQAIDLDLVERLLGEPAACHQSEKRSKREELAEQILERMGEQR